jgi:hypothetical protein
MLSRSSLCAFVLGALVLSAALLLAFGAQAHDDSKYPNWEGKWNRDPGPPRYDPSKPPRRGQQPPLTAEYQKIGEASLADQAAGGQGNDTTHRCIPVGMPRQATSGFPIEIVITAKATYILFESSFASPRKIHTDGRDWPKEIEPTLTGYSIGRWIDEDGDGRYDVLEVETRGFKGPRHYDAAGLPLHHDNQSVFKERIYLDKNDKNILHNEITVYDHALTRPWTVTRDLRRNPNPRPTWREFICTENNPYVRIGQEIYYFSADGLLMPMRKGQPAPDLRHFTEAQK